MPSLLLPKPDNTLETLELSPPRELSVIPSVFPRTVYAAAHVVVDPLKDYDPWLDINIDWDQTIAFREYLWGKGLGVAEAMDTAQRGMGLDWVASQELIRRSIDAANSCKGLIACGAGTDHLIPKPNLTIEEVIQAYEEQCEVVGNPVRASVANVTVKQTATPINVLVVGGSLGAQVLNETLPAVFSELSALTTLNIWHQTGKNNEPNVTASYQRLGLTENSKVAEFIDDMDSAYQWADLVICRAGALTVSEIAAAGRMALFVPFPHAVDDHQTANAAYLVNSGAALMMQQNAFSKEAVVDLLTPYLIAPEKISIMASKAKQLAILDATAKVANRCEQLVDRRDS